MRPPEVIRRAPPIGPELDPAAHAVVLGHLLRGLIAPQRQLLRFDQLQLQRHRQALFPRARAEPDEHLAGLHHFARDDHLLAVEVRLAGSRVVRVVLDVRFPDPPVPFLQDQFADLLIRVLRHHADAAPDRVRHIRIHRRGRPRTVAHRVAIAGEQLQPVGVQERVLAELTRIPSNAATPSARRIVGERPHRPRASAESPAAHARRAGRASSGFRWPINCPTRWS